ncbi:hypothetical protein P154DRAFT_516687 [Amniculicola lignicola CBS 123094]|uniref:Transcription initiation factor TFIID subunit 12 domain-containing protein n=1 Tax=Amniculicola lignicola CBS 123094 TaxID=1392246 RepID=A0A6A5X4U6_9PLEO|nr:hypothetical protein P154DRAFT_516687 [Amniculicola lignicola CBS 123094]
MSNPQAAGPQGGPPQQAQQALLKPDDILKLQSLNDDLKQKYRPVLQNFWTLMQSKPAGSAEYVSARERLQNWSTKLINQERQFRMNRQKQQQGQQAQQPQASNQAPAHPQPAQPTQQSPPVDTQPAPQEPPKPPQNQPAPAQARPPNAPNPAQPTINPEIIKHVQAFNYFLPPPPHAQPGTPEGDMKIKELKNSYLMALNKQEKSTHRVKGFQNLIEQRTKNNQEVPQELRNQREVAEADYNKAKRYVEEFRKTQGQYKILAEQRRAQAQAQAPPQGQPQPQQALPPQAHQPQAPQQSNIKQEAQIKVEGGAASQPTQFSAMQSGQQQPQQNVQAQTPVAQQPRPPPAPHSQTMPPNQQFTQPGQPQIHGPPRPQINPQQANAHQQHQTNSPHPHSATAGPPVPLSHQAAVSAAQRSYSNPDPQRTATPQQAGQPNFHTPGRDREQLNNPKMPIPRTLNTSQPQPVSMGQSRPTMSGPTNGAPGQMGQPVINKFPAFQLEGDGDRVLSKRKLDELVRQVTGGTEEALTPEVEETILQLADDFVDNVIGSACKLSKLRESTQLDIRDIQLVLERNYNIRIPGFSSDEVRTVRKLVPAPGWTQKMNAVQAAKVMGGGKTDL